VAKQRKGRAVDVRWRTALAKDVEIVGDREVARAIGISRNTLARVVCGFPVYGGTVEATRAYLAREQRAA
jgi:hypothetical protein